MKNKNIEENYLKFLKRNPYPFSYGYEWTEAWSNIPLIKGESIKELLVWKDYSLWYFFEYYFRDHAPIPHNCFSEAFLYIDFYEMFLKNLNKSKILVDEMLQEDYSLFKKVAKKLNISVKVKKIKKPKFRIQKNKFLARNYLKFRLVFRYLLGKLHRNNINTSQNISILTNDRHSSDKNINDAFFGSIVKEIEKNNYSYNMIEYDRVYSPDNIWRMIKKYFLKKTDSNFIGDYYTLKTLFEIFKLANSIRWHGQQIIKQKGFKYSLKYKGVNFYSFVKKRLNYVFDVMGYYVADTLIINKKILEKTNPKIMLLEHEKNFYDKSMIINALHTPTKTICFEGELVYEGNDYLRSIKYPEINNKNSLLWRPLPDLKLMWGEYSKKWFSKNAHYPSNLMKVIGAPKYDHLVTEFDSLNKKKLLKKYSLKNMKTVLVISGGFSKGRDAVKDILNLLKTKKTQIIVKLHPDESTSNIKYLVDYCKNNNIENYLFIKYAKFTELLVISNLVITYQSTLCYDVVISKKPLIIFNDFNGPIIFPIFEKMGTDIVSNIDDLKHSIDNLLSKSNLKHSSLQLNKEKLIKEILYIQDGKASERALKTVGRFI